MKEQTILSRRSFFKTLIGFFALTWVGARAVKAQDKKACDLPLVEPNKGNAAALNYVTDKGTIKDAKLKIDRNGVKFADQVCQKCMLWTKGSDCTKGSEVFGKCSLFPQQAVKSSSWCSSWVKAP